MFPYASDHVQLDMAGGTDPVPASPNQAGTPCPDTASDLAPQRQNWGTGGAGLEA